MEWIKIEERLPENYKGVLIALNDGKIGVAYTDGEHWRYTESLRIRDSDSVTHWQPLPESPTD